MHPHLYALGRLWREGEYALWRGSVSVPEAMSPLRAELAHLSGPRGFTRPLTKIQDSVTRLDLPDYRPRHGVERKFFRAIAEASRPGWVNTADWMMISALSIAAQPAVIRKMICKARYEVFDYIEYRIPYIWEWIDDSEEGGRALHLDRPVP